MISEEQRAKIRGLARPPKPARKPDPAEIEKRVETIEGALMGIAAETGAGKNE